ncbi:alpha/beta-hydrolase [Gymnopus androsaceus JB14]|uniref:carboxypeptidase C n=1 Tax=Gymnopus androsaceus JB14 TaxID=1447944 RepID=A0A6A4IF08_9AGAR|nr:alpha/beta-hydrolase [Gymnopus androsaceus JB14]
MDLNGNLFDGLKESQAAFAILLLLASALVSCICTLTISYDVTPSLEPWFKFNYWQYIGLQGGADSTKPHFYASLSNLYGSLCPGVGSNTPSYSGYIGLKGDTKTSPRRSFFWYFGAESHDDEAPVILTMGGGPGTSGFMNAFYGQSPCIITADGLVPNPYGWTERYHLIVLDHASTPIGAGFSYAHGVPQVNNSRDAAWDVYDFLQKFYILFPRLAKNKLIIAGGSYGGVYVPNIATVIQEGNRAVASQKGRGQFDGSGANLRVIHLESLMIHNPISDVLSHFRWLLQYRCVYHNVYNTTQCQEGYALLPSCLEALDFVLQPENSTPKNRFEALELCEPFNEYATETPIEDIRLKCKPKEPGPSPECYPQFIWITELFSQPEVKATLGVPQDVNYTTYSTDVARAFEAYGDLAFRHHLLYEPLLADGIRLLHYVGAQDANCAWPGVLSFLKLIRSPYQENFINSKEIPWPDTDRKEGGYVRVVGEGAGNMTFVLIEGAGHFSVHDQPAVVKSMIEHWIENEPFVE